MHILAFFKALLNGPGAAPAKLLPDPVKLPPDPVKLPPDPAIVARVAAYQAQLAADFRQAAAKSAAFEQHYGEFAAFLYRPDFDVFLRGQVLDFWEPEAVSKTFLDKSHWLEKYAFNFPGPFYTGESDSCGTGIGAAPENVANDAWYREYIYRQPTSYYELQCVLNAAATEVFDSYSADGNDHWTYAACRQWWHHRPELLHHLSRPNVLAANEGQAQRYADYLRGPAALDLRRYCYFLEHGAYPPAAHTALPDL